MTDGATATGDAASTRRRAWRRDRGGRGRRRRRRRRLAHADRRRLAHAAPASRHDRRRRDPRLLRCSSSPFPGLFTDTDPQRCLITESKIHPQGFGATAPVRHRRLRLRRARPARLRRPPVAAARRRGRRRVAADRRRPRPARRLLPRLGRRRDLADHRGLPRDPAAAGRAAAAVAVPQRRRRARARSTSSCCRPRCSSCSGG